MGRQSQEEVQAAARRRLDLLRRELEQAGLRPVDDSWADSDSDLELPEPAAIAQAGRHARARRPSGARTTLGELVPEPVRGRAGLSAGPALLVIGLVAVALVVTAVVVLRMDGSSQRVAAPRSGSGPLVSTAPAPSGTSVPTRNPTASPAASATVTVDVAGKVRRPGVATLPAGSRVVDALKKAGGPRGGVDLSSLNLARVLVDGEQILVGRPRQPGGLAAGASTSAPPATGSLVNLNTAGEAELDTLPGVGPVTAQKILQWREAHGAFSSVDELLEVDGIGEKTLADLAPLVTL